MDARAESETDIFIFSFYLRIIVKRVDKYGSGQPETFLRPTHEIIVGVPEKVCTKSTVRKRYNNRCVRRKEGFQRAYWCTLPNRKNENVSFKFAERKNGNFSFIFYAHTHATCKLKTLHLPIVDRRRICSAHCSFNKKNEYAHPR